MTYPAGGRGRRKQSVPVLDSLGLAISGSVRGVFPVRVMLGFKAGLLLLLLVGCATPHWQENRQQDIMLAHPEWSPEVRGAVAAGVIGAGMDRLGRFVPTYGAA